MKAKQWQWPAAAANIMHYTKSSLLTQPRTTTKRMEFRLAVIRGQYAMQKHWTITTKYGNQINSKAKAAAKQQTRGISLMMITCCCCSAAAEVEGDWWVLVQRDCWALEQQWRCSWSTDDSSRTAMAFADSGRGVTTTDDREHNNTCYYEYYEGLSINKLQNGAIPLILKIGKIRNIRFVGNWILNIRKIFVDDVIIVTSSVHRTQSICVLFSPPVFCHN